MDERCICLLRNENDDLLRTETNTLSSGPGLVNTQRGAIWESAYPVRLLKPPLRTILLQPAFLAYLVAHTGGLQEEGRQESTGKLEEEMRIMLYSSYRVRLSPPMCTGHQRRVFE